ncbi:MAG: M16 family metallopeptidase [Candidatus Cryptobacteroides sp.]
MIVGTADCGIRYAVRRSTSSVGYCALSIKCGTRDEEGFHSGIAHFAEHTIFKGTDRRSASVINSYLDRLGGELNAFTTKEEIVFHATVLKEDLGRAASLLFELATSPSFPENELEKEKCVVIDEINSYKDSPSEDIYDKFEELLFKGHPLSKPILGTAASVKKITRDELVKFVKEKFIPGKMAFTVVADIDEQRMEKEVLKLAGKYFKDIRSGSEETDGTGKQDREVFGGTDQFDKTANKRNHQANCILGSLAPSLYMHRERLATVLLCNILGGPASNSILNSVLREKNGWVYGVECTYTQYADTGIAAISIGCDKDNLDRCIREVEKELDKIKAEPLSDRKLRAAKKQLLGQIAISSDNGETQCLSMGKGLMDYGRVTDDARTKELVEGITAEDVREMACRIFDRDRMSRLIYI